MYPQQLCIVRELKVARLVHDEEIRGAGSPTHSQARLASRRSSTVGRVNTITPRRQRCLKMRLILDPITDANRRDIY
jgi:hypothetical protein